MESGIIKFKMQEGLPNTQICPLDLGSKERQLQNSDLMMTYMIVAGGLVISMGVFISELIFNYFHAKNIDKNPSFKDEIRNADTKEIDNKFTRLGFKDSKKKKKKRDRKIVDEDDAMPPPPAYYALFRPPFAYSPNGMRKTINGTEYWVVKTHNGDTRLIPIRSPSAVLYNYTN